MKPTLVILAAGMGSRYGGLKQMDPMDEFGSAILDFSVFDAIKAGFEDVIFIIKKEIEEDFKNLVGKRIEKAIRVRYAYQELYKLPEEIEIPKDRVKPWGTAHAVMCAADMIEDQFVVLNCDDFYCDTAFKLAFDFLSTHHGANEHAIIGYKLMETLTDNGSVNRGVCQVKDGKLVTINERLGIVKTEEGAAYPDASGELVKLPPESTVSMNFWAFNHGILDEIIRETPKFLKENITKNPLKCEDHLPEAVRRALEAGRLTVDVLTSPDRWIGVTHKDDKPSVVKAICDMREKGLYPSPLWK